MSLESTLLQPGTCEEGTSKRWQLPILERDAIGVMLLMM